MVVVRHLQLLKYSVYLNVLFVVTLLLVTLLPAHALPVEVDPSLLATTLAWPPSPLWPPISSSSPRPYDVRYRPSTEPLTQIDLQRLESNLGYETLLANAFPFYVSHQSIDALDFRTHQWKISNVRDGFNSYAEFSYLPKSWCATSTCNPTETTTFTQTGFVVTQVRWSPDSPPSTALVLHFELLHTWLDPSKPSGQATETTVLDVIFHASTFVYELRFHRLRSHISADLSFGISLNNVLFTTLNVPSELYNSKLARELNGTTIYFIPTRNDIIWPGEPIASLPLPNLDDACDLFAETSWLHDYYQHCSWHDRRDSSNTPAWNSSFWPTLADMQTPDTYAIEHLRDYFDNDNLILQPTFLSSPSPSLHFAAPFEVGLYPEGVTWKLLRGYLLEDAPFEFGAVVRTFGTFPHRVSVLRLLGHWRDIDPQYNVINESPRIITSTSNDSVVASSDIASLVVDWCFFEADLHLEVRVHSMPRQYQITDRMFFHGPDMPQFPTFDERLQSLFRSRVLVYDQPVVVPPSPQQRILPSITPFSVFAPNATYSIVHTPHPTPSLFYPSRYYALSSSASCLNPNTAVAVVDLKMRFVFMGKRYSHIGVGAQNVLFFERLNARASDSPLPIAQSRRGFGPFIAFAFSEYRDYTAAAAAAASSPTCQQRRYQTFGVSPHREFVLRLTDWRTSSQQTITMDVVLREYDGAINLHVYRLVSQLDSTIVSSDRLPAMLVGISRNDIDPTAVADYAAAVDVTASPREEMYRALIGSTVSFRAPSRLRECVDEAVRDLAARNDSITSPIDLCSNEPSEVFLNRNDDLVAIEDATSSYRADVRQRNLTIDLARAQLDANRSVCVPGGNGVFDFVPLGMNFVFGGSRVYTGVVLSSLGNLHFASDLSNSTTNSILDEELVDTFSFARLDMSPGGACSRRYQTLGEFPNRVFVLQLTDVRVDVRFMTRTLTLDVLLFERNGSIEVRYYMMPDVTRSNLLIGVSVGRDIAAAAAGAAAPAGAVAAAPAAIGDDDEEGDGARDRFDYTVLVDAVPINSQIHRALVGRAYTFSPIRAVDLVTNFRACNESDRVALHSQQRGWGMQPTDGFIDSCYRLPTLTTMQELDGALDEPSPPSSSSSSTIRSRPDQSELYSVSRAPREECLDVDVSRVYDTWYGRMPSLSSVSMFSPTMPISMVDDVGNETTIPFVALPIDLNFTTAPFRELTARYRYAFIPTGFQMVYGYFRYRFIAITPSGVILFQDNKYRAPSISVFGNQLALTDGAVQYARFVDPRHSPTTTNASVRTTGRATVLVLRVHQPNAPSGAPIHVSASGWSSELLVDVLFFERDGAFEIRYHRVPVFTDMTAIASPSQGLIEFEFSPEPFWVVPRTHNTYCFRAPRVRNFAAYALVGHAIRFSRERWEVSEEYVPPSDVYPADWRCGLYADPHMSTLTWYSVYHVPMGADLCASYAACSDRRLPYWCEDVRSESSSSTLLRLLPDPIDTASNPDRSIGVAQFPLQWSAPFPFAPDASVQDRVTPQMVDTVSFTSGWFENSLIFTNDSSLRSELARLSFPLTGTLTFRNVSVSATSASRSPFAHVLQIEAYSNAPSFGDTEQSLTIIFYRTSGIIELRFNMIGPCGYIVGVAESPIEFPVLHVEEGAQVSLTGSASIWDNPIDLCSMLVGSRMFFYPAERLAFVDDDDDDGDGVGDGDGDGDGWSISSMLWLAISIAGILSIAVVVVMLWTYTCRQQVVVVVEEEPQGSVEMAQSSGAPPRASSRSGSDVISRHASGSSSSERARSRRAPHHAGASRTEVDVALSSSPNANVSTEVSRRISDSLSV